MCKITQDLCAKLTVGAEAIPKLSQNLSYHPAAEIATIQAPSSTRLPPSSIPSSGDHKGLLYNIMRTVKDCNIQVTTKFSTIK